MSNFGTALLKILTLGIYGSGKVKKDVKRYRKDGVLRVDKSIEREGVSAINNGCDISTDTPFGSHSVNQLNENV